MTIHGTDISHWHPIVDADKVRASPLAQFVIAKVTEGTTYFDPTWLSNRDKCLYEGVPVSGFHFYRYGLDPIAQADWFASKLGGPSLVQTVWCDIETAVAAMLVGEANVNQLRGQSDPAVWHKAVENYYASDQFVYRVRLPSDIDSVHGTIQSLAGDVLKFLQAIEAQDYEAGIYSSRAFLEAFFAGLTWPANYPLWLANYGVTKPIIPAPWVSFGEWGVNPKVPIWQYTDGVAIEGIDGLADGNYWSPAAGDMYTFFGNGEPYEEEEPTMIKCIIVNTAWLRVRSGPGLTYSILDTIPRGLCLYPHESKTVGAETWYRVGYDKWVAGSLCSVVNG
jgi:GH25 family lysozyme M1 (1,4-beta-N-acetylmuramidase)